MPWRLDSRVNTGHMTHEIIILEDWWNTQTIRGRHYVIGAGIVLVVSRSPERVSSGARVYTGIY